MIGRIKPVLNALQDEDRRHYRAHYCGICVATKRVYGRRATLGHSSELVFISLLLEALEPEAYRPGRAGCPVLPLVRRKLAFGPPRHAEAIAAGALATLQLDLKDARKDGERRIKQLFCRPHLKMKGRIDPEGARNEPFVREAIGNLPKDEVGEIVAGVVGSVFRLAGHDGGVVATGCRIGHVLGRLMNLSDALEDYRADRKAGRPNALAGAGSAVNVDHVERQLERILVQLDDLVKSLPLRRNRQLLDAIVNVHARARARKAVEQFRIEAGIPRPEPARPACPANCLAYKVPVSGSMIFPPGSEVLEKGRERNAYRV